MPNLNHPLIEKLRSLNLPAEDYAVFGSGPLYAHGIRDISHDLDVVARGAAWGRLSQIFSPQKARIGNVLVIELDGGEMEFFSGWAWGNWTADELIDSADIIDGIRFVALRYVLKWKQLMGREKDQEDVKLIDVYLSNNKW